ncbi:MAG: group I intron-associated PD-(D/E)XK endonuclease [Flavobacteriales bacterium]|jgi:hypothetical protein|tara:strand:+ start:257 stop:652 length:396 start_codon:yes stop_codon:yes gene_type:complete
MPRATERVGRSGEYLTAALLSLVSDTVMVVPHGSEADLVFEHNNKLYKVQVKTSSKINTGRVNWRFDMRRGSHSKDREYQKQAVDIFALVSLKYRNVVFIKPMDQNQITIADEHMKNNDSVKNLNDILDNI